MIQDFRDYYNNNRYESPPLAAPCNSFTDIYYTDAKRKIKTNCSDIPPFTKVFWKGEFEGAARRRSQSALPRETYYNRFRWSLAFSVVLPFL